MYFQLFVAYRLYDVPKDLYTNARYKTATSNDAKMLYALLLDRMKLSRANNWADSDGTIFLIFKREDLADSTIKIIMI